MGGDFEDETVEGLCDWANGLGLCEFEIIERYGDRIVAVCGKDVEITMRFGRFAESLTGHGGNRIVNYSTLDNRKGDYLGHGMGSDSRDELERALVRDVERLGLYNGQMRLF